jgi:phospholipid:diacylglycerol acyltransferase
MSFLRRRKATERPNAKPHDIDIDTENDDIHDKKTKPRPKLRPKRWSCVDTCYWLIGCVCSVWWFFLFLFSAMPASFPQYVTEAITGPLPDPPGVKLKKEGLTAMHPVVFVPGIVTGGLELWEGHQCAEGLFRKRLWGGTFGELYRRYWLLGSLLRINSGAS